MTRWTATAFCGMSVGWTIVAGTGHPGDMDVVAFWGWRAGIISYFWLVEVLFLLTEAIFWQWPWLGARESSTSWVESHLGKVCKLGGCIPRGCWWVPAGGGRGESIGADSRLVVLGPRGHMGSGRSAGTLSSPSSLFAPSTTNGYLPIYPPLTAAYHMPNRFLKLPTTK
jgi:hypothetical protein